MEGQNHPQEHPRKVTSRSQEGFILHLLIKEELLWASLGDFS